MGVELRSVTEDEFPAYARAIATAFGSVPDEQGLADWRATTELDRTIAAFDGSEIVGTAGAYSFELTLPGAVAKRAAGGHVRRCAPHASSPGRAPPDDAAPARRRSAAR